MKSPSPKQQATALNNDTGRYLDIHDVEVHPDAPAGGLRGARTTQNPANPFLIKLSSDLPAHQVPAPRADSLFRRDVVAQGVVHF
jgi:hypothetical protein